MLTFIKRLMITFVAFGVLWFIGLFFFVFMIPTKQLATNNKADAAIVLTGGAQRIDYGLSLLANGQVGQVFISGVNKYATHEDVIMQAKERMQSRFPQSNATLISIGREATSTIGNAEEAAAWIADKNIKTIRLVTANYHMPRSILEFKAVLSKNIKIYPDPVFPEDFSPLLWWKTERVRSMILIEYHKTIASIIRHLLIRLEHAK